MKKKHTTAKRLLDCWISVCGRKKKQYFPHRIEMEISSLNPGGNTKKIIYEFYAKKISLCISIIFAGLFLILIYIWSESRSSVLIEENVLRKNPAGSKEKKVTLDARVGEFLIKDIGISVPEKTLTTEEAERLLEEIAEVLPNRILGENGSLSYVDKPLILMNEWDDAPVSIFWQSSNYEVLQENGEINYSEIPQEGIDVSLCATLFYEDISLEKVLTLTLYPPALSEEEEIKQDLLTMIETNQKENDTEPVLQLPNRLGDFPVKWKDSSGKLLPMLFFLLAGSVVTVFTGRDRELHNKYERRKKILLSEYPEFVCKLQLLICSGMSIRGALIRIGNDYQKKLKRGGKKQYVCEELLLALRKVENGMNEAEALGFWAERCNLFCYKKLVSLILQNLKRGTEGLREALFAETQIAFEERKRAARKLGEEAETKLLMPMMLMLGIVLVIIVIPAYLSFGGI